MPDAIYNLILDDVTTLSEVVLPAWNRAVRKQIKLFPSEILTLPWQIIIPDFQADVEEAYEEQICMSYRVGVALLWEGNQTLEDGLRTIINSIRDVRQALYVPVLPTASTGTDPGGVFDVSIDFNPPFDVSAIPLNVDYSLMRLTYKSWELRNG